MRRLVYLVGGQETTSYAKAREIQPRGQLETRLDEIREEVKVNPKMLAKRQAYFAKRRAEKAVASLIGSYQNKKLLTKASKAVIINISNKRKEK